MFYMRSEPILRAFLSRQTNGKSSFGHKPYILSDSDHNRNEMRKEMKQCSMTECSMHAYNGCSYIIR